MPFEIILPFGIRAEGVAGGSHPLGIELDQLLGDILDRRPHPGFGLLPFLSAQTVELHLHLVLGADIFGDQVELGDRDIQGIALVILELEVILDHSLHLELLDALVQADAVGGVDDVIPRRQLGEAVDLRPLVSARPPVLPPVGGDPPVGDDREARLGEIRAGRQPPPHDQDPSLDRLLRGGGVKGGQPLLLQILRQGLGVFFLRPGQYHTGHIAVQHIPQVIAEEFQSAGPYRKLTSCYIIQRVYFYIRAGAGKGLEKDGVPLFE